MTTRRHEPDETTPLRTPDELVTHLRTVIEKSEGDAAFVAATLRDIVQGRSMRGFLRGLDTDVPREDDPV